MFWEPEAGFVAGPQSPGHSGSRAGDGGSAPFGRLVALPSLRPPAGGTSSKTSTAFCQGHGHGSARWLLSARSSQFLRHLAGRAVGQRQLARQRQCSHARNGCAHSRGVFNGEQPGGDARDEVLKAASAQKGERETSQVSLMPNQPVASAVSVETLPSTTL